jgi:C-22 sterol desaturase
MTGANGAFASPLADAGFAAASDHAGLLKQVLDGVNGWTIAVTALLLVVAYDQCKYMIQDGGNSIVACIQS